MCMTLDLFASEPNGSCVCTQIAMPDADVCLYPAIFLESDADQLFSELKQEIIWEQEQIEMYGRVHNVPRLTAWYGDEFKTYTYSGITAHSRPWTNSLLTIKDRIESISSFKFNSVLLNLYRSGNDSVSWHSDDEPELGRNPIIASLSLGQTRTFQMKHKTKPTEKQKIVLKHGDFLLMKGCTQHHWLHQIPKSRTSMQERINLTFRVVE